MAIKNNEKGTREDDNAKKMAIKTVLAEFLLCREDAANTFVDFPETKEKNLVKAYIDMMKTGITVLFDELDTEKTNAIMAARVTKGLGQIDSVMSDFEDEDLEKQAENEGRENKERKHIAELKRNTSSPTYAGRKYQELVNRCSDILNGDKISIEGADFIARSLYDIANNPLFEAVFGAEMPKDAVEAFKNVAENIGDAVSDKPFVRLRNIITNMFGSGSIRAFEGLTFSASHEENRVLTYVDLGSIEKLENMMKFVASIDGVDSIQGWDDRFVREVKEISEILGKEANEKLRVLSEEPSNAVKILNTYSGIESKTAKEALEAAKKAEEVFTKTAKLKVSKETDENEKYVNLPASGLGQVFDPRKYEDNGKDVKRVYYGMYQTAHQLYLGRNKIQDNIITAGRVLCGLKEDSKELDHIDGPSWFQDAVKKSAVQNVTPIIHRRVAGSSLKDLLTTWFVLDSAVSKLESCPVELLPAKHPVAIEVAKNLESCRSLRERLYTNISAILDSNEIIDDLVKNISDAEISEDMFYRIESSATERTAEGIKSFLSNVSRSSRANTLKDRDALEKHIKKIMSKSPADEDWKEISCRFCESCGYKPSMYPYVINKDTGKPEKLEEKSADLALLSLKDKVESLFSEGKPERLSIFMDIFQGFEPWEEEYKAIVKTETEKRKNLEITRARQYFDILKESVSSLVTKRVFSPDLPEMNYTEALVFAARETNIMGSAMLTDVVLKKATEMINDKEILDRPQGLVSSESFRKQLEYFMNKAKGVEIVPDKAEDFACAVFMPSIIRNTIAKTLSSVYKNFDKNVPETEKTNNYSFYQRFKPLATLNTSPIMDFADNLVLSDKSLKDFEEVSRLLVSAKALPEDRAGESDEFEALAKRKAENTLLKMLPPVTNSDKQIPQYSMDADRQKEEIEAALDCYRRHLACKQDGVDTLAQEELETAKNHLKTVSESINPWFDARQAEDVAAKMDAGDPEVEHDLLVLRWASPDAAFNEGRDVSDKAKLRLSRNHMKEMAEKYADLDLSWVNTGTVSENDMKMMSGICLAIIEVFSPVSGCLIEKGIKGDDFGGYYDMITKAKTDAQDEIVETCRNTCISEIAESALKKLRTVHTKENEDLKVSFDDGLAGGITLTTRPMSYVPGYENRLYSAGGPSKLWDNWLFLLNKSKKNGVTPTWNNIIERVGFKEKPDERNYADAVIDQTFFHEGGKVSKEEKERRIDNGIKAFDKQVKILLSFMGRE